MPGYLGQGREQGVKPVRGGARRKAAALRHGEREAQHSEASPDLVLGLAVLHAVGRRVGYFHRVLACDNAYPPAAGNIPDDMPPQWSRVSGRPRLLLKSGPHVGWGTRSATCALSLTMNLADALLPMFRL